MVANAVHAEWDPGVDCPGCGSGLRVAFAGHNDRGFPVYEYRCLGCNRRGDWANLARTMHQGSRDTRPKVSWGSGRRR